MRILFFLRRFLKVEHDKIDDLINNCVRFVLKNKGDTPTYVYIADGQIRRTTKVEEEEILEELKIIGLSGTFNDSNTEFFKVFSFTDESKFLLKLFLNDKGYYFYETHSTESAK